MAFATGACCAAILSQQRLGSAWEAEDIDSDPPQKFISATSTVVEAGRVVVKPAPIVLEADLRP